MPRGVVILTNRSPSRTGNEYAPVASVTPTVSRSTPDHPYSRLQRLVPIFHPFDLYPTCDPIHRKHSFFHSSRHAPLLEACFREGSTDSCQKRTSGSAGRSV